MPSCLDLRDDYERLLYTPAGNTAVLGLAKQAIAQMRLGRDEETDLMNICLDASRRIAEAYGPESMEVEDMLYRLDRDLDDFLTFLFAQVDPERVAVVLTSDHGTSPSYDAGPEEGDRFNVRQFEVIVNGFLNARYGAGEWVLDYEDKSLYLNHNLIYERGLNLAEVQNEVAIFAMQFRGVSHAQSATAVRTSYFGSGYARMMQNSYYPRRSGDVLLNFMPGWIEQRERCVSMSGSMYGYDREVPLLFYGAGAGRMRVARRVDPIAPEHRTEQYAIQGCQSRVWVDAALREGRVYYTADSDAVITKGIIALLVRVLSGRTPQEILSTKLDFIDAIGLQSNLSPTRANGLLAMIKQMRLYALAFDSKEKNE